MSSIVDKMGDIIRGARKLAKLTQQDLADMAEITRSTLSEIENGKSTARMDVMERLFRALHVEVWMHYPDGEQKRWM